MNGAGRDRARPPPGRPTGPPGRARRTAAASSGGVGPSPSSRRPAGTHDQAGVEAGQAHVGQAEVVGQPALDALRRPGPGRRPANRPTSRRGRGGRGRRGPRPRRLHPGVGRHPDHPLARRSGPGRPGRSRRTTATSASRGSAPRTARRRSAGEAATARQPTVVASGQGSLPARTGGQALESRRSDHAPPQPHSRRPGASSSGAWRWPSCSPASRPPSGSAAAASLARAQVRPGEVGPGRPRPGSPGSMNILAARVRLPGLRRARRREARFGDTKDVGGQRADVIIIARIEPKARRGSPRLDPPRHARAAARVQGPGPHQPVVRGRAPGRDQRHQVELRRPHPPLRPDRLRRLPVDGRRHRRRPDVRPGAVPGPSRTTRRTGARASTSRRPAARRSTARRPWPGSGPATSSTTRRAVAVRPDLRHRPHQPPAGLHPPAHGPGRREGRVQPPPGQPPGRRRHGQPDGRLHVRREGRAADRAGLPARRAGRDRDGGPADPTGRIASWRSRTTPSRFWPGCGERPTRRGGQRRQGAQGGAVRGAGSGYSTGRAPPAWPATPPPTSAQPASRPAGLGDADNFGYARTEIRYGPTAQPKAALLARYIGGVGKQVADSTIRGTDLVLVIGADWKGVTAPADAGQSAAPAPPRPPPRLRRPRRPRRSAPTSPPRRRPAARARPADAVPAPSTRILVTGAGGQVGSEVAAHLPHHEVVALDRAGCDLADRHSVEQAVAAARPGGGDQLRRLDRRRRLRGRPGTSGARQRPGGAAPRRGLRPGRAPTSFTSPPTTSSRATRTAPTTSGTSRAPGRSTAGPSSAGSGRCTAHAGSWAIARTSWVFGRRGRNFVDTIVARAREGASAAGRRRPAGLPDLRPRPGRGAGPPGRRRACPASTTSPTPGPAPGTTWPPPPSSWPGSTRAVVGTMTTAELGRPGPSAGQQRPVGGRLGGGRPAAAAGVAGGADRAPGRDRWRGAGVRRTGVLTCASG